MDTKNENIQSKDVINFGEHFMLDGYEANPSKLDDRDLVYKCLDELPEIMKMGKLSPPVVFSAPDNGLKDPGGWSGFVVIAESHISIHTFPKRGFVSADVYTCQNGLDIEFIRKYFRDTFELKDIEENFVKRGTKYPVGNIHD